MRMWWISMRRGGAVLRSIHVGPHNSTSSSSSYATSLLLQLLQSSFMSLVVATSHDGDEGEEEDDAYDWPNHDLPLQSVVLMAFVVLIPFVPTAPVSAPFVLFVIRPSSPGSALAPVAPRSPRFVVSVPRCPTASGHLFDFNVIFFSFPIQCLIFNVQNFIQY